MVFWQLLILWWLGHLRTGNVLKKTKRCHPLSKCSKYIFVGIVGVFSIFVLCLIPTYIVLTTNNEY